MNEKVIGQAIYNMAYDSGFKHGYKKAIDEFVAEMFEIADGNSHGNMFVWCSDIKEIAEQLKEESE